MKKYENYHNAFSDIHDNAWYADYVQSAKIKGVISEKILKDNCLFADRFIDKDDFREIILNVSKYKEISANEEVYSIFSVAPEGNIVRDYAATIITQLYKNIIQKETL